MKGSDYFEQISAGAISPQIPPCKAIIINAVNKKEITDCLCQLYSGQNYKIYIVNTALSKLPKILKRCHEAGIPAIVNCGKELPSFSTLLPDEPYTATLLSPGSTGENDITSYILSDPRAQSFSTIGYQGYRHNPQTITALQNRYFEDMRLGIVRNDLALCEPLIRNAQYAFVDMRSVRYADYPYSTEANPNGLYAEEICTIARYIGLAQNIKTVFLFGEYTGEKSLTICNKLISEVIWHICEGLASNLPENPTNKDSEDGFSKKIVSMGQNGEEISFITSYNTGRWWMEIPAGPSGENTIIPCSAKDYQMACSGEIPLRWLFFYQKYILL